MFNNTSQLLFSILLWHHFFYNGVKAFAEVRSCNTNVPHFAANQVVAYIDKRMAVGDQMMESACFAAGEVSLHSLRLRVMLETNKEVLEELGPATHTKVSF